MSDPNRKGCSYSEKPNSSDLIYRQDAINEAEQWIKIYSSGRGGQRERDAIKQAISGIKKLPSAQPKYEELTPEETASEIASGSTMFARYCLDAMIQLKQMGYAICRKR